MVYNIDWFNLSTYQASNPYNKPEFQRNKAKVGYMTVEAAGYPISEFIDLRPKMYPYLLLEPKPERGVEYINKQQAKGIHRFIPGKCRHDEYKAQINTPD